MINSKAKFLLNGGYLLVLYSSWNAMSEITQVGISVQCKSMHGYPAAATYTNGTNLSFTAGNISIDPNTRFTLASHTFYAILPHGQDDHLLKVS